jgi:hypothetical protein
MTLRSIALVVGALVLTGPAFGGGSVAAADGCSVHASGRWIPYPGRVYGTEAFSSGPTCAQAAVTLVVRAPDGGVAWVDAAPGEHVMTFADVKTRQDMSGALTDWLSQSSMFKTTRELPAWPEGAQGPESGEFPFMPEAWIDRDYYERSRAQGSPMFCYVQGMESIACIALSKDGQMEKIGVQSFPG